jgi:hypothetical protein
MFVMCLGILVIHFFNCFVPIFLESCHHCIESSIEQKDFHSKTPQRKDMDMLSHPCGLNEQKMSRSANLEDGEEEGNSFLVHSLAAASYDN